MVPEKFLTRFVSSAINHVLRQNAWSFASLKMHCGKNIRFCIPLQELNFLILENGELTADVSTGELSAMIYVTGAQLPRLLLGDTTVWREIETRGELELSTILISIFEGLRWDIEDDLSHYVGDIPARFLVNGVTKFSATARQAALNVGRALSEYWVEEQAFLVKTGQVEQFAVAVASLARAANDFEVRFAKAANRVKVDRR